MKIVVFFSVAIGTPQLALISRSVPEGLSVRGCLPATSDLARWNIVDTNCQEKLPVCIALLVKHRTKPRFIEPSGAFPLVVGVRVHKVWDLIQYFGCVLVSVENEDRGFGVPPARIPEQLVDDAAKRFRAAPELALRDEDVPTVLPDQDVRLAVVVKRFPRRLSFVMPVWKCAPKTDPPWGNLSA